MESYLVYVSTPVRGHTVASYRVEAGSEAEAVVMVEHFNGHAAKVGEYVETIETDLDWDASRGHPEIESVEREYQ